MSVRAAVDSLFYAVSREDLLVTDAVEALRYLPEVRAELNRIELRLIEALKDAGLPWDLVGEVVWGKSREVAQTKYRRLGGTRYWPAGRR